MAKWWQKYPIKNNRDNYYPWECTDGMRFAVQQKAEDHQRSINEYEQSLPKHLRWA